MEKSKTYPKEVLAVIPKGWYCHGTFSGPVGADGVVPTTVGDCPFLFKIKGRPKQEDGYCVLLGTGDYEMNRRKHTAVLTYRNPKTGKSKKKKVKFGPSNPSFFSLLWDQCKECGLKIDF